MKAYTYRDLGKLYAVSCRGVKYCESPVDGSWWIIYDFDRPKKFIGHRRNLPKEIKKLINCKE